MRKRRSERCRVGAFLVWRKARFMFCAKSHLQDFCSGSLRECFSSDMARDGEAFLLLAQ